MTATAHETLPQVVTRGGGSAWGRVLKDVNGFLDVPQAFRFPEVMDYDFSDKANSKTLKGAGNRAIAAMHGDSELTISITLSATYGKLLNNLCYGQDETATEHVMYEDLTGIVVPGSTSFSAKIRNCIAIHFGRWDSTTTVKIGGVVASVGASAGMYNVSTGIHTFNKSDIGKNLVIIYVSNGTSITFTGKVPSTARVDVRRVASLVWTVKNDQTVLTQDTWNPAGDAPITAHYQASPNGVLVLASTAAVAANKTLKATVWVDGQTVTLTVADFPDAAYQQVVDPPSAAAFVSHTSIELIENTGTGMTGVNVGEDMTEDTTPSASGKYSQDDKGWYLFNSSDNGDTVRIYYVMDCYSIKPVYRDSNGVAQDADYIKDWGVRNAYGKPLTRVSANSPLSISQDQYAVDETIGIYYLDYTNAGERLYFDAEFATMGGVRIEVKQQKVGSGPVVELALNNVDGDGRQFVTFEYAVCEGMGTKTKHDDYGDGYKFTFKCAVNRITGLSHAINMSS